MSQTQEIVIATIAWYAKSKEYGAAMVGEDSYLFHKKNCRFCKQSESKPLIFTSKEDHAPPMRVPREGDRIVFIKNKRSKKTKIKLWGFADQWEEQAIFS